MTRPLDAWALALLSRLAPAADRDALVGDLLEARAAGDCDVTREVVRSLPALLELRVRRAGGVRALAFAGAAAVLGVSGVLLALVQVWTFVLVHVPRRAAAPLPVTWWWFGLPVAVAAGWVAGRSAHRLAVRLLGGRA